MKPLIELKGIEKIKRHLNFGPVFSAGLKEAGLFVKSYISTYPRQRRGPQPFKTPKQRRFFFWAVRHKVIQVPYFRGLNPKSKKLGQSWTLKMRNNDREAVIGSNVSYGPWVQDEKKQSKYHKKSGWPTTQGVHGEKFEEVRDIILQEIRRHLEE